MSSWHFFPAMRPDLSLPDRRRTGANHLANISTGAIISYVRLFSGGICINHFIIG
jgi:hypothetical protein